MNTNCQVLFRLKMNVKKYGKGCAFFAKHVVADPALLWHVLEAQWQ